MNFAMRGIEPMKIESAETKMTRTELVRSELVGGHGGGAAAALPPIQNNAY